MWGGDAFIPVHWSYTKLAILLYFPHASLPPQHRRCSGSSHRSIMYLSFLLLKHKSTACDTSFQTVVTSSTASGLLTGLLDASLSKAALPRERDEYWETWRTGWGSGGERRTHPEGGRVNTHLRAQGWIVTVQLSTTEAVEAPPSLTQWPESL